jgi:kinesin family protein 6/9
LFQEIQSRYEQQITVRVSYIEIYNETIFDLLAGSLNPDGNSNIVIQEDIRGGVHLKGAIMKTCNNEEEALSMLFEGETNRTIAEHKLNKGSTRSHCIFTLYIEMRSRVESSEKVILSKINLVDLAGSERTKKTGESCQEECVVLKCVF